MLGSVIAVMMLVGCGSKSSSSGSTTGTLTTKYASDVQHGFQVSCEAEANAVSQAAPATITAYCRCALAYIEAHLSYKDFEKASRAVAELKASPDAARAVFAAATKTCRAKFVLS